MVEETQSRNERGAIGDGTGKQTTGASAQEETALAEVALPLEELVRRGAREIIQRTIEADV